MSKRDDILTAALELITEEGLQSMTFSKLFKRANVGSGTVYNYFTNKEELVGELYLNTIGLFSDAILKDYDNSLNIFSCFKRMLTNMALFAQEHQKEQWFLENYSHSPFIPEEVRNREIPAMAECMKLIERGMNEGLIRKINPMMCTQMISGMLLSAVQGALMNKYPMEERDFEQVIEICWRSIVI